MVWGTLRMWSGARLRGRETWAPRNSVRKGLIVMLDSMGVWELNWAFGLGQRVRVGCVMLPYTARDTDTYVPYGNKNA